MHPHPHPADHQTLGGAVEPIRTTLVGLSRGAPEHEPLGSRDAGALGIWIFSHGPEFMRVNGKSELGNKKTFFPVLSEVDVPFNQWFESGK